MNLILGALWGLALAVLVALGAGIIALGFAPGRVGVDGISVGIGSFFLTIAWLTYLRGRGRFL